MAFTYDTGTDAGKIRLLIFDTDSTNYVFEDEELNVFYSIEGSSVKRAAALASETIASNEAFVLKVFTLMDMRTDGAATARAMFERAALLRAQAEDEEFAVYGAFEIAEWVTDDFSARERLANEVLRG